MTTLLELSEFVARSLRDPDGKAFDALTLRDLINAGIVDINRVMPIPITEDIVPVANTYEYTTRITKPKRLELWDNTTTPPKAVARVVHVTENRVVTSNVGYEVWNGKLRIPLGTVNQITVGQHRLKFWGYGPRLRLAQLEDVFEGDDDAEQAVREFAVFSGYELLMSDRSLFTQWQTYPTNKDISATQLGNAMQYWQSRWQQRRRQLRVLSF